MSAEETALAAVPVARRVARDDEIPPNFRPAGGVLWDPWFFSREGEHHVFYLRVVEHEGRAHLLYTGRRKREFWYQRIGLAVSDDGLETWSKVPDVLVEPDPRHSSTTHDLNALGVAPAWRDPCVFRVPGSDLWHMTISARTAGDRPHNACVGLARSADLREWEVLPPLLAPGVYDEMEATQVVHHDGRWYVFFSTWAIHYRPDWAERHGAHSGLHCYVADDLHGPYRPVNDGTGVVLPDADRRYTVRLLGREGDGYTAMGWLNYDEQNRFVGTLSDPLRIVIDGDTVTAGPSKP